VSSLERLGWTAFFAEQRDRTSPRDLQFARVVEEQRDACRVSGDFDGWAEAGGRFRHEAISRADFPVVGDWVGVRVPAGARSPAERAVIDVRLQRRSTIARSAAGRAVEQQVIAANVDVLFIVTALTRDLNPRRLERYLTLVWDAGAVPVVVLNKADVCEDAAETCRSIRSRLPGIDVVALSALRGDGLDRLEPYLRPASTIALLGSSGVGKSTLVNRLIGGERQRVSGLDADGKGRHTTTSRRLIELAGGALLIDTPGMKEVEPWGDPAIVEEAFDDITALAVNCRFGDCAHQGEPGCAVASAIEAGRMHRDRLENYQRLRRELAFEQRKRDKSAAAAKRKLKQMMQAQKALYRDRDRS
jgi:ribosome biogenesis GTPase